MSKRDGFGIYRRTLQPFDDIITDLFISQNEKIASVQANYQEWLKHNRMEPKRYRDNRKRPPAGAPYTPEFAKG